MLAKAFWAAVSLAATLVAVPGFAQEEPPAMQSEVVEVFDIPEANQGIGVDAGHFYAIDNTVIAKYAKDTRQLVKSVNYEDRGAVHFDSAAVVDGRIYVAHSNYSTWPMTSSLEVFDAATLDHVESYSFGIQLGSFTWVDRAPDGSWWGGFANYNRVFDKSPVAYGNKFNTQVVRFTPEWEIAEQYVIPDAIVEKFDDMSNSGGSWGPDGKLYLTGHDPAEAYVMEAPEIGSTLKWLATVPLDIRGQGIAWDRSQPDILYGIIRGKGDEQNRVSVNRVLLNSAGQ
ncbi:cycloisomerase [Chelativorans sp.]|uniref:cycloisomerase n=1 Tax=Chelativorans sp. TaxID=2203393 RepID=UPI002810F7FC|nr:cycloisomerase [Chelativorans sp.]